MHATINKDTPFEIQWSDDDPITPILIENIHQAGMSNNINWKSSEFYHLVELLLEKYRFDELEELLFDEDPEIAEIGCLLFQNPMSMDLSMNNNKLRKMIRLYYPVLIVINRIIKESN